MADVVPMEPRELSAEEMEARALECSRLDARVRSALSRGREALWDLASALYDFREASAWTALGYESLGEYLADPDVTLTWPTFDRLVQGWRELAVNRAVDSSTLNKLHPSKVQIVLPALTKGRATLEQILSDAEVLGQRDLRIKYTHVPEEPVLIDEESVVDLDEDGDPISLDGDLPAPVDDQSELEPVPWHIAQTLAVALEAVMHRVGKPSRKAISTEMREMLENALAMAHEHGLGSDV